jgi:hypothetical protein
VAATAALAAEVFGKNRAQLLVTGLAVPIISPRCFPMQI